MAPYSNDVIFTIHFSHRYFIIIFAFDHLGILVHFFSFDLCSEGGHMCAIKEVRIVSDDQNSRESLKQLNQVSSFYLFLPNADCFY